MIEKQLAEAIVKATAEIVGATKDANNPHFKSDYASLESVISAVRPALHKYGLSFVQVAHPGENAKVETILVHESGASLSCGICEVPVDRKSAQGYGSALTYARRYSLSLSLGVPTIDDDGEGASAPQKPPATLYTYLIPDTDMSAARVKFMESVAEKVGTYAGADGAPGVVWKATNNLGEKLEKYLKKNDSLTELLKANAGR